MMHASSSDCIDGFSVLVLVSKLIYFPALFCFCFQRNHCKQLRWALVWFALSIDATLVINVHSPSQVLIHLFHISYTLFLITNWIIFYGWYRMNVAIWTYSGHLDLRGIWSFSHCVSLTCDAIYYLKKKHEFTITNAILWTYIYKSASTVEVKPLLFYLARFPWPQQNRRTLSTHALNALLWFKMKYATFVNISSVRCVFFSRKCILQIHATLMYNWKHFGPICIIDRVQTHISINEKKIFIGLLRSAWTEWSHFFAISIHALSI